jgi:hypothetical protein
VGLQVRDAHPDPLPLIVGLLDCWRTHERPRLVTGPLRSRRAAPCARASLGHVGLKGQGSQSNL